MAGIYVHIPFCKTRCLYCGFYSTTLHEWQDRYVDALLKELILRKRYLGEEPIETIYLGGGTPSQLRGDLLRKLICGIRDEICIQHTENTSLEVTVECNPDDITPEFATLLYNTGVNRVSMGAQTFSTERLQFLRRRHTPMQVEMAVETLRAAGIRNISIDLMFGFPGQTLLEWQQDIRKLIDIHPEHISAYSLMYEEDTPLYAMLERGEIVEIDEEESRNMYYSLIDMLSEAGYEQYEISNFALPGFRSRHNSSYWKAIPYLGLGAGAHSYDGNSRQWNISNLVEYTKHIEEGLIPAEIEVLDDITKYNDIITTALRTKDGININDSLFGTYLQEQAEPLIAQGVLINEKGNLRLTRKGLYVSDDVMAELIYLDS